MLKAEDPFSIGDFLNPGILDALPPSAPRTAFISRIVDLLWDPAHDKMVICGFNMLLDTSTQLDAHLGDYNLEDEKTEITRALVDTVGAHDLIQRCRHGENIKLKISFLENVFRRERPEKISEIAREIVEQVPANILARNIVEIFEQDVSGAGSFPLAALRFFPLFMGALSEDKKTEYGAAILNAFGPKRIVPALNLHLTWMGNNHVIRGFINAFPLSQAEEIVERLVDAALARDYDVSPETYDEAPDMYWEYAKFAISVHDIIPEKCLAFYEGRIIDHLNKADCLSQSMVTAAILLRGRITEDGEIHRTREIDFYPTQSYTTSHALAHIKPQQGQNSPGTVTVGDFIGTLPEYFNVLAHPPQGAPRYLPPNGKQIDRGERYALFSAQLRKVEEQAAQGLDTSLPSLQTFLQSRQPAPQQYKQAPG